SKGVPEQAMGAVESSVPVAQKIKNEGIGGVWEQLKEKVGDLKENLLGKISEYLIPTVLIAGITWLVSLLNPASAFIKACKAIIDIVMFIVERGAQIMAFVNAVLDAVIAIAGGGAGGVPGLIETALATAIPVLIGFLAALLGIGGLADKVKKLFQSLSKPVMKAVDWIVEKIAAFGKQLWAKLKSKFGKKREGKELTPQERQAKLKAGLAALDGLTSKYSASGATEKQMAAGTRSIKRQYPVFVELSATKRGEKWEYRYVASPPMEKSGPPASGSSFSHAPGGLAVHEGHKILTAAKPKEIHLITKHGEKVTDAMLKKRLTDAIDLFKVKRARKIQIQLAKIASVQKDLDRERRNYAMNPSGKTAKKIQRYEQDITECNGLISGYQAINENDREAVFDALNNPRWREPGESMVTKEATHFTDNKVMEVVARDAISANRLTIDAAFSNPDGSAKPNGTSAEITYPVPPGVGAGYELDPNNLVVPISRPLSKVILRLLISDGTQRHFMIETAYFK
ncbi:MAG: hypothetical protein ACREQV_10925, partial [Candidatus Binatia bacterium]